MDTKNETPSGELTNAEIRAILLAHGYEIKPGLVDLKWYVYEGTRAVIAADRARQSVALAAMTAERDVARGLVDSYVAEVQALRKNALAAQLDGATISSYSISVEDKIDADELDANAFIIERTRQRDGSVLWVVRANGRCLNKSGEWEWEPMPSSRDDEFLARCRFDSAVAARAALAKAVKS
jgi:hypothetical protein